MVVQTRSRARRSANRSEGRRFRKDPATVARAQPIWDVLSPDGKPNVEVRVGVREALMKLGCTKLRQCLYFMGSSPGLGQTRISVRQMADSVLESLGSEEIVRRHLSATEVKRWSVRPPTTAAAIARLLSEQAAGRAASMREREDRQQRAGRCSLAGRSLPRWGFGVRGCGTGAVRLTRSSECCTRIDDLLPVLKRYRDDAAVVARLTTLYPDETAVDPAVLAFLRDGRKQLEALASDVVVGETVTEDDGFIAAHIQSRMCEDMVRHLPPMDDGGTLCDVYEQDDQDKAHVSPSFHTAHVWKTLRKAGHATWDMVKAVGKGLLRALNVAASLGFRVGEPVVLFVASGARSVIMSIKDAGWALAGMIFSHPDQVRQALWMAKRYRDMGCRLLGTAMGTCGLFERMERDLRETRLQLPADEHSTDNPQTRRAVLDRRLFEYMYLTCRIVHRRLQVDLSADRYYGPFSAHMLRLQINCAIGWVGLVAAAYQSPKDVILHQFREKHRVYRQMLGPDADVQPTPKDLRAALDDGMGVFAFAQLAKQFVSTIGGTARSVAASAAQLTGADDPEYMALKVMDSVMRNPSVESAIEYGCGAMVTAGCTALGTLFAPGAGTAAGAVVGDVMGKMAGGAAKSALHALRQAAEVSVYQKDVQACFRHLLDLFRLDTCLLHMDTHLRQWPVFVASIKLSEVVRSSVSQFQRTAKLPSPVDMVKQVVGREVYAASGGERRLLERVGGAVAMDRLVQASTMDATSRDYAMVHFLSKY